MTSRATVIAAIRIVGLEEGNIGLNEFEYYANRDNYPAESVIKTAYFLSSRSESLQALSLSKWPGW
jgi:hypothetical protein